MNDNSNENAKKSVLHDVARLAAAIDMDVTHFRDETSGILDVLPLEVTEPVELRLKLLVEISEYLHALAVYHEPDLFKDIIDQTNGKMSAKDAREGLEAILRMKAVKSGKNKAN